MIRVDVFYPKGEDKNFDLDYYCNKHLKMVQQLLGPACTKVAVEQGVSGMTNGSPPIYMAIGHLYFESAEAFHTCFDPNAKAILDDIPIFTNITPLMQISEIVI